jgi:hypothetical protein
LYVAQETALIYTHEWKHSGMSLALDSIRFQIDPKFAANSNNTPNPNPNQTDQNANTNPPAFVSNSGKSEDDNSNDQN